MDEGYDAWRKAEIQDLSQMMLAIVQSNPELAKDTSASSLPQFHRQTSASDSTETMYPESFKRTLEHPERSSFVLEQSIDTIGLGSSEQSPDGSAEDNAVFAYIPSEPRVYYRFILAEALSHDLNDANLQNAGATTESSSGKLLSKESTELLNEISVRWRIPLVSRIVLFLDVFHEKFIEQEITLDTLDAAFNFAKEPLPETRKGSDFMATSLFDRKKWSLTDVALNQQILSDLHDALMRDLYATMQQCYEQKPPNIGPIMYVLEHHVCGDPSFTRSSEDLDTFTGALYENLRQKAHEMYKTLLEQHVPQEQNSWDFFHVIELGKAVTSLAQKIQKRYKKNPEIMGYV